MEIEKAIKMEFRNRALSREWDKKGKSLHIHVRFKDSKDKDEVSLKGCIPLPDAV